MNKTKILLKDPGTGVNPPVSFSNWVAHSAQFSFSGEVISHEEMATAYSTTVTSKVQILGTDSVPVSVWWTDYQTTSTDYVLDNSTGVFPNIGFNDNPDLGPQIISAGGGYNYDVFQTTGNPKFDPYVKEIITDDPDAFKMLVGGGFAFVPIDINGVIESVVLNNGTVYAVGVAHSAGAAAIKTALDGLGIGTWTVSVAGSNYFFASQQLGIDYVRSTVYDGGSPLILQRSDRYYFSPSLVGSSWKDGDSAQPYTSNIGSGPNNYGNNIEVRADGKIVVGGNFTSWNGTTANFLVQLNSDASIDTSFMSNFGSGFNGIALDVDSQSDNKVVVSGLFTSLNGNSRNFLVRLNSNGTEDTTFYSNLGSGFSFAPYTVEVQADGKILVGGPFAAFNGNTRNRLVRLNSDGTEDTSFYTNLGSGFNDVVNFVLETSSNKIIVVGRFTSFNGNTRNRIVCLNSDGTEDTSFYTNCGTAFNAPIRGVVQMSSGDLVFYGDFTTFNGSTAGHILKLHSDGTVNTTFATGSGLDTIAYNVAEDEFGDLIVGGPFSSYNGISVAYLCRIKPNGDYDQAFNKTTSPVPVVAVDTSVDGLVMLAEINGFEILSSHKPDRASYDFHATGYDYAYQSGVLSDGAFNAVKLSITGVSGTGELKVWFGSALIDTVTLTSDGDYVFSGTASGADLKIGISYGLSLTVADTIVGDFISSNTDNAHWLDTYETVPFPVVMQVADIRDIGSRNSDYTKTITLPGSKNNNIVFKNIFGASVQNTYDLSRKAECYVYSNDIIVMRGFLQLTNVYVDHNNVEYEVVIYGNNTGLFTKMGNKYVKDLDWSDLSHTRDESIIVSSWSNTTGYVYPLVDHGFNFDYTAISNSATPVTVSQMYPAVYAKTIVDKIFENAEYTYTSNFLNGSDFAKMLVVYKGDGKRNVKLTVQFDYLALPFVATTYFDLEIVKETSGGIQTVVASATGLLPTLFPTASTTLSSPDVLLESTDIIYVRVNQASAHSFAILASSFVSIEYNDNGVLSTFTDYIPPGGIVTPATAGYYKVPFNTSFKTPGFNINITQAEFIIGLMKMFNLYIEPMKDNPTNLVIEPRDDFYNNSVIVRDWTKKLDLSKPLKYQLMSELQNKTFRFTYKNDTDFYNDDYTKNSQEVFGQRIIEVDNDFVNDEKVVETVFASTPTINLPNSPTAQFVLPVIGKKENDGTFSSVNPIPRILYYKYTPLPSPLHWYFESTDYTSVPYVGHFDDPYSPANDLNYGGCAFYYSRPAVVPANNLYNLYWKSQTEEIQSIDSRLLTAYFRLKPSDIYNLQFSDRIFVNGLYYRLNKVDGYDPGSDETTRVELIKALDISIPSSLTVIE